MDLLDSIMSKMAKPPSVNNKQKKLMKEQQQAMDNARSEEREQLSRFRRDMEKRIHTFMLDNEQEKLRLEPMEQVARSVVRDVADVAGLTTYTFGVEGEDRHVMLFKKDYPVDERELTAYRNGEDWNLADADKLTAQLAEEQRQDEFRLRLMEQQRRQQNRDTPGGGPKFLEKIDRLVGGRQTGRQAAKGVVCDNDRTFGFVRCELKKDKRTIEETLADIKAKKQKREQDLRDSASSSVTQPDTASISCNSSGGGGGATSNSINKSSNAPSRTGSDHRLGNASSQSPL